MDQATYTRIRDFAKSYTWYHGENGKKYFLFEIHSTGGQVVDSVANSSVRKVAIGCPESSFK